MSKTFLDKAYDLDGVEATQQLYSDWSKSYDQEVSDNGYVTHNRIAEALAKVVPSNVRLLDFGCGTGLSGLALRAAGFEQIDGCDISQDMLEQAKHKNAHDNLAVVEPGYVPTGYDAIAAIGVIGAGAAPIETFDQILDALEPGGVFATSFNDHALDHPEFATKVEAVLRARTAHLVYQDYGDHLPGINLNSMIYVLVKN
ncbi:class I SAM-dependent DNA methyltransferase [Algirhabdus cladophorae]|uniref:class I SAM-dependent DNA methyltransferase n=1 Tax=Algirhabdus cladophorae TaxID=3377108 RepID=UPI003B84AA5B